MPTIVLYAYSIDNRLENVGYYIIIYYKRVSWPFHAYDTFDVYDIITIIIIIIISNLYFICCLESQTLYRL